DGYWLLRQVNALGRLHLSLESVVAQALAKQIGEIQSQAPPDRVEVQQSEYPKGLGAAFHLAELTILHPCGQLTGKPFKPDKRRRPRPIRVRIQTESFAADGGCEAPGHQYVSQVTALHPPLVPAARRLPAPAARDLQPFERQIEIGESDAICGRPHLQGPGSQRVTT